MSDSTEQAIKDPGRQWNRDPTNDGHYASAEWFADICGPLLSPVELQGARVAETGSGTGRIVRMLIQADADHVLAVEPSRARCTRKYGLDQRAFGVNRAPRPSADPW